MANPDRREFAKVALGGALGAALLASPADSAPVTHTIQPGIKLCAQSGAKPTDNDLLFLQQIGAEYVSVGSTPDLRTAEGFQQIRKRYADAWITVCNIGNTSVHNMPEVTLNLPGRDKKIEEYKQYLRNLGAAGIYYTTYAHMGNGIWSSGRATIRGASAREFDMASPNKQGVWDGVVFKEPLSHGREFSREEIWENYTYFIRQVAPVAEEVGVRIGSIRTTRRCRCWPVCRAVSSAALTAIAAPWRSPAVPTSVYACAAGRGWKAAGRSRARIRKR